MCDRGRFLRPKRELTIKIEFNYILKSYSGDKDRKAESLAFYSDVRDFYVLTSVNVTWISSEYYLGVKMEKVIIRSRASEHPSSNYINRNYKNTAPKTVNTLLSVVYEDNEFYEKLIEEYNKTINGEKSPFFLSAYLLDNRYAAVLDSHITIYKLCIPSKEKDEKLLPWRYFTSSKYLGDTWWFSDDEILNDLSTLSIVDFLMKYRGL